MNFCQNVIAAFVDMISPFGCRQNPWLGYRLSEIIGVKAPIYSYGFQSAVYPKPDSPTDPKVLRKEIQRLFQKTDDIVTKIENLKAKTVDT
jgi:hypothetical protein